MSKKLTYFDVNGYAEPIRYMLHYGGQKFEDIRYEWTKWPIKEVKDSLPYGQLPIYEEGGRKLNQSMAIARYVASQINLLPSDPWDQAVLDAAVLNIYDFIKYYYAFLSETNKEKKEKQEKELPEKIEFYLSRFEKELKANNGHFVGKLSWADFVLVGLIEILNLHLKTEVEKGYPTIISLIKTIRSLPGVKEYIATRGPY